MKYSCLNYTSDCESANTCPCLYYRTTMFKPDLKDIHKIELKQWNNIPNFDVIFDRELRNTLEDIISIKTLNTEKIAFESAKFEKKIAELSTVILCSKERKYELEKALHGVASNIYIIGSPVIPENEIYEIIDPEIKAQFIFERRKDEPN